MDWVILDSSKDISQEKLTVKEIIKGEYKLGNKSAMQDILSDFDDLDFSNGPFNYSLYDMNYNEGKVADPFDKISKYYGRNKNVFLFIGMLRDEEQLRKIMNMINEKCSLQAKDKFIERLNIYLERINKGEHDAEEFLNDNLMAFFNGYHVACSTHDRNIHENLNINIIEPGQTLETSSFFDKLSEQMAEEKSKVKRVKIYNNDQRIVTVAKNEKQQRNYFFSKLAVCDTEISFIAKDESGKELNCTIVLNINAGLIRIEKSVVNNETVELKDILELAKQNETVLVKGSTLYDVLAKCVIV